MTEPVFVDTNVLVYRFDTTEPEKQRRCELWLDELWDRGTGRVSIQVLRELYVNLSSKLPHSLAPADARTVVRSLFAWKPVGIDRTTLEGAWRLQAAYSLSWWDALLVAAAQILDCRYLLTEDLSHDQTLDGVTVIDPFRTTPGQPA